MPSDKTTLKDLVAEKSPGSNPDKYLVVAYYLVEYLGKEAFDVSDVLGAFKFMGWRIPADPANTFAWAASKYGWFDSRDTSKIRLTHLGHNALEHDLPRPAKK
jgi:hypothetical protein